VSTRSTPWVAAVACVAVLGLGACTSTPSNKAVTRDVIESLEETGGIDAAAKECMLEKVNDMSNDELNAIGSTDEAFNSADPSALENTSPELQDLITDLRSCIGRG